MSRREAREGRDEPSRRFHSSRFERSPSPKKPKRDGKPATERTHSSHNRENVVAADRDKKQRRHLLDALPLEDPVAPETKEQSDIVDNEPIKKHDALHDGSKTSADPIEMPRSHYYIQHDDRRSAGHGVRSFNRREHGKWSDGKEQSKDRNRERVEKKNERVQPRTSQNDTWKHDRFPDLEAELPPARKRPAFREKKLLPAPGSTDAVKGSETLRAYPRVEGRNPRGRGDMTSGRGEMPRNNFHSRERDGSWSTGGRDRLGGRYVPRNNTVPVEKWGHDLFEEANKSPTTKYEEEQIAKVEALLAL